MAASSLFIRGFVCTQLSHQANWQSVREDGDLFNEARGEKDRRPGLQAD